MPQMTCSVLQDVSKPQASTGPQDMSKALALANIRNSLIRQEDTIIFTIIERAQFSRNESAYISGGSPVPFFDRGGRQYSLLEYTLRETEQLHGKLRRYTSPDEHAFYPNDLPGLCLPPIGYPAVLAPCADSININEDVMRLYLEDILPEITTPGDDNNHGSAVTLDVLCLQALSKRIHYGKFVAEAKFRAQTEQYTKLIKAKDADGIMQLLTDEAVEQKVVERVRLKAATFGQDIVSPDAAHSPDQQPKYKVQPDILGELYDKWVMPLTKKVQVAYLLQRLDGESS